MSMGRPMGWTVSKTSEYRSRRQREGGTSKKPAFSVRTRHYGQVRWSRWFFPIEAGKKREVRVSGEPPPPPLTPIAGEGTDLAAVWTLESIKPASRGNYEGRRPNDTARLRSNAMSRGVWGCRLGSRGACGRGYGETWSPWESQFPRILS